MDLRTATLLTAALLALSCSDYKLEDQIEEIEAPATTEDPDRPGDQEPDTPGGDTAGDTAQPGEDEGPPEQPGDTGEPPGDTGGPPTIPDFDDCEDGYYADYYNLPADHPEVEIDIGGVVTGDNPANHDWWDEEYFVRREVDANLEFGDGWWPVDEGLPGDPQYFAVHWFAYLYLPEDEVVFFELGSDDDSWAYIDGEMVADLGGIHDVTATLFAVALEAGVHELDLYMAERHTSGAGFWFKWNSENLDYYACP